MEKENQRTKKMEFLDETIWRCLNKEPELSLEELAVILHYQAGEDLEPLLKELIKQNKKGI